MLKVSRVFGRSLVANSEEAPYLKLINQATTELLSDQNGRKIYRVNVSVPFRRKYLDKYGSFPWTPNFELKYLDDISGNL